MHGGVRAACRGWARCVVAAVAVVFGTLYGTGGLVFNDVENSHHFVTVIL